MRRLVVQGLEAGACGFSTTRSAQHNGEAGIPMPSRLADEQEMLALSGSLKDAGRGILMMTKGADTPMPFIEELAQQRRASLPGGCPAPQQPHARGHLRRPRPHRRRAQPRQPTLRRGVAVSAYLRVHLARALCVRGAGGVAAADEDGRTSAEEDVVRSAPFVPSVKAELDRRTRRMFNGEWEKMFVTQAAQLRQRRFRGELHPVARSRGGQASAGLHARPEPGGESGHAVHCHIAQFRRGSGGTHAARSQQHRLVVRCRARTSHSCAMPALACTSSATGCAISTSCPWKRRCASSAPKPRSCSASVTADGSRPDTGPTCCCSIPRRSAVASPSACSICPPALRA